MNYLQNHNIAELNKYWKSHNLPFPHVLIPNFLENSIAESAYSELKDYVLAQRENFVKYEQRWERLKFTQNKWEKMPAKTLELIRYFNSNHFIQFIEKITNLENLLPDDGLWGGGIHSTFSTGKLDIHNDFTVLPTTYGKEKEHHRVLNLILYLNQNWQPNWHGELELWDSEMTKRHVVIQPKFNTGVLFYTYGSNHGQPDPYQGPENEPRLSLATYYYQPVVPGSIPHRSTLYQIRPGETETEEEKKARMERASEARYSNFKTNKP